MTQTPTAAPRHWQVHVEHLDGGLVRLSSPQARGEVYCARGPLQLWTALTRLRMGVAAAGLAAWHGQRTELDMLTEDDDPTEPRVRPDRNAIARSRREHVDDVGYGRDAASRPDVAAPETWTPLPPEGDVRPWRSPQGRRWSQLPAGVMRARARMGLATSWEEWAAQSEEVSA